jgi:hypothetical protein
LLICRECIIQEEVGRWLHNEIGKVEKYQVVYMYGEVDFQGR